MPDTWYIVAAIVFAITLGCALGYYGRSKGYPFLLCFMLGVVTTPLVGWIIVALLPEREHKDAVSPQLRLAIELEKAKMAAGKGNSAG